MPTPIAPPEVKVSRRLTSSATGVVGEIIALAHDTVPEGYHPYFKPNTRSKTKHVQCYIHRSTRKMQLEKNGFSRVFL